RRTSSPPKKLARRAERAVRLLMLILLRPIPKEWKQVRRPGEARWKRQPKPERARQFRAHGLGFPTRQFRGFSFFVVGGSHLKARRRYRMASNNDEVIDTLSNLIETCKDRQYGYRMAAEAIENGTLNTLFRYYELQSAQHAKELQTEVRNLGGDPEKRGSVAGCFMRGWMNIKSGMTGGAESAIVAECERGEDSAGSNYASARKEMLPTDVR